MKYYSTVESVKKINGLYGQTFKVYSSKGNYIFIADEQKTGILQNKNDHYEQLEQVNYNELLKSKFSLLEKYNGYIINDDTLKIVKLRELSKYVLTINPDKTQYYFVNQKEVNLYPYTNVHVKDFCFYQNNSLIFYDKVNSKFILINLENNNNEVLSLTNISNVAKLDISPNYKKLIIYTESSNLIIYDLEDRNEYQLKSVLPDYIITKTGVSLIYHKNQTLSFLNLYTQDTTSITLKQSFDQIGLSFSERYCFLYNQNQFNIYDLLLDTMKSDVLLKNTKNKIDHIWPLYNDHVLIYGKLFDLDSNEKLDYRDLNYLIDFDYISNKIKKIIWGIDDFLGLSNYNQYILYRNQKSLFIKNINYEKKTK